MLCSPPRIRRIAHGCLFVHSFRACRPDSLCKYCVDTLSKPSRNPTSFYSSKRPILSSPSTLRRRPQRTILPWECSEGRRVSRRLLRQNVNCQSGVRKLGRCALGVYMCHTKGVSANLIILTQEDIRRTRAISYIAEDLRRSNRGSFVHPILPNPMQTEILLEIALRTGSKVCLHVRGFISLISLEGLDFRPIFRSFFHCSRLFFVKQALS